MVTGWASLYWKKSSNLVVATFALLDGVGGVVDAAAHVAADARTAVKAADNATG